MALIVGNKVARHAHWLVLEEECQRGATDRKSLVTNVRPTHSKIVRARDCIIHANLLHVY